MDLLNNGGKDFFPGRGVRVEGMEDPSTIKSLVTGFLERKLDYNIDQVLDEHPVDF